MPRLPPVVVIAAFLLVAALPAAASAATCSVRGQERKLGPTYVTRLVVSHTSCTKGKALVKAFFACRKANGGADGRCTRRVSGYACREIRRNVIATQYDATVTCRNGSRKVVHDYTQFT